MYNLWILTERMKPAYTEMPQSDRQDNSDDLFNIGSHRHGQGAHFLVRGETNDVEPEGDEPVEEENHHLLPTKQARVQDVILERGNLTGIVGAGEGLNEGRTRHAVKQLHSVDVEARGLQAIGCHCLDGCEERAENGSQKARDRCIIIAIGC